MLPQIIRPDLLKQGFDKLYGEKEEPQYDVTDDVSLVELIGKPVKITEGAYTNIKVRTPCGCPAAVGVFLVC